MPQSLCSLPLADFAFTLPDLIPGLPLFDFDFAFDLNAYCPLDL